MKNSFFRNSLLLSGAMSGTILRDCVIMGAMAVGVVFAFNNKDAIYAAAGLTPVQGQLETTPNAAAVKDTPQLTQISSGTVSIRKSDDGHFWAQSRVNGAFVKFLVDTGASTIALTLEDARKAGYPLHELDFNRKVNTANGSTAAAYVTLKSVSVGTITLRDVDALIIKEGLSTSLLGMSYLGQLQKVEATPQSLILRL